MAAEASAQESTSRARIVIAGAGAAGPSLATRLRREMPNAAVTLIDANKEHHFQPGFTLVAADLWNPADFTEQNADYVPRGMAWVEQAVPNSIRTPRLPSRLPDNGLPMTSCSSTSG